MRPLWLTTLLCFALLACTRATPSTAPPSPDPVAPAETLPPAREVRLTTSDGVTIAATLQPAAQPDAPLVVLVHQLSSTRAEWEPLLARLHRAPALATLAIDVRGHGESTSGPEGATLSWREFEPGDWRATAEDVVAAAAWARSAESGLRPASIGVIGASIGSSAVIAAAARDAGLDPIVALSPGRAYHGFDAITPVTELRGRHLLAVAAAGETDSVETAQAMARIAGSEPVIVDGDAHGVRMFDGHPELLERVEAFLRERLQAP